MPWGGGPWATPAERREEANGQTKGGEEWGGQNAVTACHAAGEALVKQRRLDTAEAGGEDFTAGIAAGGGGVGVATAFDAADRGGRIFTAGIAAGGGGVGRATAGGGAVGGGGQTSLTSLLWASANDRPGSHSSKNRSMCWANCSSDKAMVLRLYWHTGYRNRPPVRCRALPKEVQRLVEVRCAV